MITCYDVVKNLIRSEKGSFLQPNRQYLFEVAGYVNKIQIRKAIEEIYKVKVRSVNTTIMRGKNKKVRQEVGMTPNWKKAIVTLQEGQTIEVT